MKYSTELDPDKISKGYGYELHCSPKDSRNLVYALKGMKVEELAEITTQNAHHLFGLNL